MIKTEEQIAKELSEYFPSRWVRWRKIAGGAKATAYIDAWHICARLEKVLGVGGWEDSYEVIAEQGIVVCTLRIRIPKEDGSCTWVQHQDAGSITAQPDKGDRWKASFTGALRRTAVKFGIGRYLKAVGALPCEVNGKEMVRPPVLPNWALPADEKKPKPAPAATTTATATFSTQAATQPAPTAQPAPAPTPAPAPAPAAAKPTPAPFNARQRIAQIEKECGYAPGTLERHVVEGGKEYGYTQDLDSWPTAGHAVVKTLIGQYKEANPPRPVAAA